MESWEGAKPRLEMLAGNHFFPHAADIRAALERVAELERENREFRASLIGMHERAEAADAEVARLRARDEILARLEKLDTPRLSTEEGAKAVMGDGQPLVKMREI